MNTIEKLNKSQKDAFLSAAALCSRAEKCSGQIYKKLSTRDLTEDEIQEVLDLLIQEKFIDDLRFAVGYVRDKVRFNKWGCTKITYQLRGLGVDSLIISQAIQEIDRDLYLENLSELLFAKIKTIQNLPVIEQKARLYRFAAGRGYESDLIMKELGRLLKE